MKDAAVLLAEAKNASLVLRNTKEREKALYRQKKYDLIKKTRSFAAPKKSVYHDSLCKGCMYKSRNEYCINCKGSYKKASARKYWCNKRKKLCVENRTISENKAINGTGSQFNQSDCHANEGLAVIYGAMFYYFFHGDLFYLMNKKRINTIT